MFGLFLVFFLCPPQLVFSAVGVGYPTYASLKMLAEDTLLFCFIVMTQDGKLFAVFR